MPASPISLLKEWKTFVVSLLLDQFKMDPLVRCKAGFWWQGTKLSGLVGLGFLLWVFCCCCLWRWFCLFISFVNKKMRKIFYLSWIQWKLFSALLWFSLLVWLLAKQIFCSNQPQFFSQPDAINIFPFLWYSIDLSFMSKNTISRIFATQMELGSNCETKP